MKNVKWLPRVFDYSTDRVELERRLHHVSEPPAEVIEGVRKIIGRVRREGAKALIAYAKKFDGVALTERSIRVRPDRLKRAWERQPAGLKKALRLAKKRIEIFHRRQRREGWTMTDAAGATLTQRFWPLKTVGIYIPNAEAPLFSSLLMTIVPAQVAGVERIVVATPPIGRRKEAEAILGVVHLCGLDEVYQAGGAVAVAAMALGAGCVPKVDKVVGPGNLWSQMAKRQLYGTIDIDMEAGPSEILVIADRTASPRLVAADLLSQAEHSYDAAAWAILVGPYDLDGLKGELLRQTESAPRRDTIERSLKDFGMIVRVKTRAEAIELTNDCAPEHLLINTRLPEALAKKIRNAGATFLGPWTPEPIGDYVAGPNHTLPTGRTARFFSPLSVDDFVRADHVVSLTEEALKELGPAAIAIGEAEGLFAHAQAVKERL